MENWSRYVIYYPLIKHPLHSEKKELKKKYIALVNRYAENYESKEKRVSDLQIIHQSLFEGYDFNENLEEYSERDEEKILKTRFSSFRCFSYRYVFLFDCLLLFAVSDEEKGKRICEELKKHVHHRYHEKIDMMVSMMYNGDGRFADKTLITSDMVHAWGNARKYSVAKEKKVVFTATMSAGKSTLINAIIGENLSETKKAACTSTVIRFHSEPAKSNLYTVVDRDGKQCLKDIKSVQACMRKKTSQFDVVGYFSSVLCSGKFTLIDTPGVNSALNPKHRELTRKELTSETLETLIYVIPVALYGSGDDYIHLKYILENVSYARILFVVNMMDTYDPEDDSVEGILEDIRDHLKEIGFKNPIVCPVSAKAGLQLKKMVRKSTLSKNERESALNFVKLFSKPEYDLSKYYPQVECGESSVEKSFVNTGLPGLEQLIFSL